MNIELASQASEHFNENHQDGNETICMGNDGQCSVTVEIAGDNEQEQQVLEAAAERALTRLDTFFDGRFAKLFTGLRIQIGDGLVQGGAEAKPEENVVLADRKKMLMSLADVERMLSEYIEPGDRVGIMEDDEAVAPASALEYDLVHEVGHLLDEQTPGLVRHRVSASESPTKYGREPDDWHAEKNHEAFAEGFTYMVFGKEVSLAMEEAVKATVAARIDSHEGGGL